MHRIVDIAGAAARRKLERQLSYPRPLPRHSLGGPTSAIVALYTLGATRISQPFAPEPHIYTETDIPFCTNLVRFGGYRQKNTLQLL